MQQNLVDNVVQQKLLQWFAAECSVAKVCSASRQSNKSYYGLLDNVVEQKLLQWFAASNCKLSVAKVFGAQRCVAKVITMVCYGTFRSKSLRSLCLVTWSNCGTFRSWLQPADCSVGCNRTPDNRYPVVYNLSCATLRRSKYNRTVGRTVIQPLGQPIGYTTFRTTERLTQTQNYDINIRDMCQQIKKK